MNNLQSCKLKLAKGVRIFSIVFGLVWAIDAIFKWLPGFLYGMKGLLDMTGSPIMPVTMLGYNFANVDPVTAAVMTAIAETLIAFSLLFGFARKPFYILGILVSIGIYAVGEDFGGPYGNGSTDVGAAIMYVFIFVALWMLQSAVSPNSLWTLDAVIAKKWPAWAKIGMWKPAFPLPEEDASGTHEAMPSKKHAM